MYRGGEDLQEHAAAARESRRLAAHVALILLCAGTAPAIAEPLRPVVDRLGWQVDLDGFFQIDAIPWAQASQDELAPDGDPLNTETISVRRGLFRAIAKKDDVRALFEVNASTFGGTPNATINEVHLGWTPLGDLLLLQAGIFDIPFGYATPTNPRFRDFTEQPAFLRAFFPGDRDGGALAKGSYGLLRWSLAAMNGAPARDAQWKGKDPTSSYDFMGRIGGELALPHEWGRPRFEVGVSALSGSDLHPGVPPTKDHIVWIDENMDGIVQPTELVDVPGTPGEPSQKFHHAALGADARVSWCLQWAGPGHAFFEGAIATNLDRAIYYADPVANSRDLRELGFMVGAIQSLTEHGFVGIRYDRYDADRDANAQLGTTLVGVHRVFSTWAFLAAARRGTSQLWIEYDHAQNPLGLADNGMPATIGDDRVVVRAQAEF